MPFLHRPADMSPPTGHIGSNPPMHNHQAVGQKTDKGPTTVDKEIVENEQI